MTTKVARLIDRHDLVGLDAELVERWTEDGTEQSMSLRELADWFNIQMLKSNLEDADYPVLPGEAANLYRLLTDDAVTMGDRIETVRTLERSGVDVDKLEESFVSHQAMHNYLTGTKGVEKAGSTTSTPADDVARIRRMQNRITTVAKNDIERLRANGELDIGEVSVLSSLQVTCSDCGRTYGIDDLYTRGACECQ